MRSSSRLIGLIATAVAPMLLSAQTYPSAADPRSKLKPGRLDGIFYDPFLPAEMVSNKALWEETMPLIVRALRPGGAFVPFFATAATRCRPATRAPG